MLSVFLKYTLYINTRTSLLENSVDAGNLQFALIFSKGPSLGRLGSLQGSFVDARLFAEIICVQTFMRFHIFHNICIYTYIKHVYTYIADKHFYHLLNFEIIFKFKSVDL